MWQAHLLPQVPRPLRQHHPSRALWAAIISLALAWASGGVVSAEEKKDPPKIPPPEELELETRDGVILKATFFPGTQGKETVPVVLIHGYEGNRTEYAGLAKALQAAGHALLLPDLRGHGQSVQAKNAKDPLKATSLKPAQFAQMVEIDLERCKRFLMEKNNQGELNINKLCVVGSEMGAVVAANWTLLDWSWPALANMKQGHDVKALVLISPDWTFKNLNFAAVFTHPQVCRDVSVLILVGADKRKAVRDAERINGMFERTHSDPEKPAGKDLFYIDLPTSLQGTKLVNEKFQVDKVIAQFIQRRLVSQSFPWQDRRTPLDKAHQ
jgi:pimeloyl-ACP methyl ester carboxylesterase